MAPKSKKRKPDDAALASQGPPTAPINAMILKDLLEPAISKSLFEEVGGFDPAYVLGDFEDSDLCLKVLEAGKRNVICRDVELNHLERQSQNLVEAGDWKHKLTIYNAITYNQRWSQKLNQLFDLDKGTH